MVARRSRATALQQTPWAKARWLVIAPHADDETLGAGALIADAAARDALAGVVFLTDGAGSHSHVDDASRRRLIATRRREATLALRRLAPRHNIAPVFLGWPDANPHQPTAAGFESTRRRIAALCRTRAVDAVAVTAGHEPHCDHAAASDLAYAATLDAGRPLTVFEYIVWADREPGPLFRAVRTPSMSLALRRHALLAHRSQVTPSFGLGFRLPAHHHDMAATDILYTRRNYHAA